MAATSTRCHTISLSAEMAPQPESKPAQFRHGMVSSNRLLVGFSLVATLVLLSGQAGAADDSQGAQLAAACASCHSIAGSDEGIPIIVGLGEQTIIDAIMAYRASETPSHVMHAVAMSLSDEELASVARYLAAHEEEAP